MVEGKRFWAIVGILYSLVFFGAWAMVAYGISVESKNKDLSIGLIVIGSIVIIVLLFGVGLLVLYNIMKK